MYILFSMATSETEQGLHTGQLLCLLQQALAKFLLQGTVFQAKPSSQFHSSSDIADHELC